MYIKSMNFNTFTSVISVQWPLDSTPLKEYNLCHSSARTLRVLVLGMSHLLFDVKILSIKIRVFGHVDKEFRYLHVFRCFCAMFAKAEQIVLLYWFVVPYENVVSIVCKY